LLCGFLEFVRVNGGFGGFECCFNIGHDELQRNERNRRMWGVFEVGVKFMVRTEESMSDRILEKGKKRKKPEVMRWSRQT
jgi:hypothetical protein